MFEQFSLSFSLAKEITASVFVIRSNSYLLDWLFGQQTMHCWLSIVGSESAHSLHMSPFCLIISHIKQTFAVSSYLLIWPLANETTVSLRTNCASFTFSTSRTVPLVWLVYLLTAVWVTPRSCAASLCFSPWDSVSCLAMADRMDGITDLTATSQGSNIFCFTSYSVSLVTYINMAYVIFTWRMPWRELTRNPIFPQQLLSITPQTEATSLGNFSMTYAVEG